MKLLTWEESFERWRRERERLEARARKRTEAAIRAHEVRKLNMGQATPSIRMIVSDWYPDEFGNRCRTVHSE